MNRNITPMNAQSGFSDMPSFSRSFAHFVVPVPPS
jgi:hypothetical protein